MRQSNKRDREALNMRLIQPPRAREDERTTVVRFRDGDIEEHPQSIAEFFAELGWAEIIES